MSMGLTRPMFCCCSSKGVHPQSIYMRTRFGATASGMPLSKGVFYFLRRFFSFSSTSFSAAMVMGSALLPLFFWVCRHPHQTL